MCAKKETKKQRQANNRQQTNKQTNDQKAPTGTCSLPLVGIDDSNECRMPNAGRRTANNMSNKMSNAKCQMAVLGINFLFDLESEV